MTFTPILSRIKPPFPEVFDNTMRSAFRACPQKFHYEFLQCLRPDTFQEHLHAGAAFADGAFAYREAFFGDKKSHEEACLSGFLTFLKHFGFDEKHEKYLEEKDSIKSFSSMSSALLDYFEEYHGETDPITPVMLGGRPANEKSFTLPIDVAHPVTGQPILYTGRFDCLAEHRLYPGGVYIVDDKTTSQLGTNWAQQWDLRAQFTGYAWGAKSFGHPIAGVIIRGVGIYKKSIAHKQVIVHRSQYDIDRWYEQLCKDVRSAIRMWESMDFDYDLADACSAFGGCSFKKFCTSQSPERFLPHYKRVRWLPHEQRVAKLNDLFEEIP